ncbi:MFS transporter [Kribbella sp. NPDC049584]|uniref:MFS transporter n=1 Tax=Kribbella sp. NPDC049584 TaxID=3154833 RepID=UPI0034474BD1
MSSERFRTAIICAVQFVDVMGVTVVVAALPRMLADVDAPAAYAGLLVPAYAVGFGGLLLLTARLGDLYGPRRVLLAGLAVFAAGSLLCAVAASPVWLVAGRLLQGVGAAASVPNALVLLVRPASQRGRGRVLSAWNATGGLAGASGLLVGGLVTSALGWRVIFWSGLVAVAVLAVAIVYVVVPDEPAASRPLNLPSISLQVLAVAALVGAANAANGSWRLAVLLLVVAAVAVPPLVIRERRTAEPLIPRGLRQRSGVAAGVIGSFGITATTSSLVVLTTLYFQDSRGLDAAHAGLLILPFSFAVVIGAAVAGRLLRLITPGTALLIALAMIGGSAVLAAAHPGLGIVLVALAVSGLGNGIGAVAAYALGTAVAPDEQAPAAGLLNTAAQLGTAIMVAVGISIADATGDPLKYRAGWITVAATAVLIAAGVLCGGRGGHGRRPVRYRRALQRGSHDTVRDTN